MPPSDAARVMSASSNALLLDDLVPRMNMMAILTAANESLVLNHLAATEYDVFNFLEKISACI